MEELLPVSIDNLTGPPMEISTLASVQMWFDLFVAAGPCHFTAFLIDVCLMNEWMNDDHRRRRRHRIEYYVGQIQLESTVLRK